VIEESLLVKNQLFSDRPTLYILGEMRELWDSETQHHLELADYILSKLVTGDKVILLWQAMSHTFEKLQWWAFDITHYLDRHDVITKSQDILTLSPSPYFIIAKGSQNTIFLEEVVKSLLAHPEDSLRLTRQGSFWEGKKR
jgi:UDP-N-acetylmuramyl pentapeptide synthase